MLRFDQREAGTLLLIIPPQKLQGGLLTHSHFIDPLYHLCTILTCSLFSACRVKGAKDFYAVAFVRKFGLQFEVMSFYNDKYSVKH